VEARYAGREIRTREAIEQTKIVVVATLMEPGTVSPGPPGTQHVDNAAFRVDRTLSPPASGAPSISGNVRVSYARQVFPESRAEAELQRGASYLLFCTVLAPGRLHATKIVPHSDDAVRVVAAAFEAGARQGADPASERFA
jgi:hypothetical protein